MHTYALVKLVMIVAAGVAAGLAAMRVAARERARIVAGRTRLHAGQSELADHSVVTLRGTVRAVGAPMSAPLSGRPCVAHRSVARTRSHLQASVREGREPDHLDASGMVSFVLVTRDGDVIVDGDRVEIAQPTLPIIPRRLEREVAFVEDGGFTGGSVNAFTFEEALIEVGTKIAVCGVARVEITADSPGEGGFRDAPTTIRLVGDDRHPLTIGPA